MKELLLQHINNPADLENLYQKNKVEFKKAFHELPSDIKQSPLAQAWQHRLFFSTTKSEAHSKSDWIAIAICIAIAGALAKIPDMLGLVNDLFYQRNAGLILFPLLSAYFLWKQKKASKKWILPMGIFLISAVYINLLPVNDKSDTLLLACLLLPFFLWSIWGFTFIGQDIKQQIPKIEFLQFNGNLVILSGLLGIAGLVFTAMTFGLFNLIGFKIEYFYVGYVLVWGIPAVPLLATYLVENNPQLVNRISPVIAKIFTPLVLIVLLSFLTAMAITQKNPYNDREFLLIFNVVLIAVMAIILFSSTESSQSESSLINRILLFSLAIASVVVNAIALSAIIFRLTEYGLSPNRLTVLVSNLLIFINLIVVSNQLFKSIKNPNNIEQVYISIARFLPIYTGWTGIVVYLFPLLFNFK